MPVIALTAIFSAVMNQNLLIIRQQTVYVASPARSVEIFERIKKEKAITRLN
jgi:hypothetical protein